MKRWIKSAIFFCLYYSGIEWILARLVPAHAIAVLMYHGVCDQVLIPPHINFHLERRRFEQQMRALKRRYAVVALDDVVAALSHGEVLKKSIVLTFDDGYKNNARYVAPILNSLHLPFTIFVVTACIDSGRWMPLNEVYWMWSDNKLTFEQMTELRNQLRERPVSEHTEIFGSKDFDNTADSAAAEDSFGMLSWDEIKELARDGTDFGSHTHSHCNMAVESEAQQKTELLLSKELLERNIDTPVSSFAYPYGYTSKIARRSVVQAGFSAAVSTKHGLVTKHSDPFLLPRLGYDPRIWMFTGEILFQFAKQSAYNAWERVFGDLPTQSETGQTRTEEGHG